jgi:hypothetical protein
VGELKVMGDSGEASGEEGFAMEGEGGDCGANAAMEVWGNSETQGGSRKTSWGDSIEGEVFAAGRRLTTGKFEPK